MPTTAPSACSWATATARSSPQQTFAVGSRPYSLAVADLTGDGRLDIVTADYGANSVTVLLNKGAGSFAPPETLGHGRRAARDLDRRLQRRRPARSGDDQQSRQHDQRASGQGQRHVRAGPGGQRRRPHRHAALGDFNGDGIADTVVLDQSGDILFRAGLPGCGRRLCAAADLEPRPTGPCHHDDPGRLAARDRRRRCSLRPDALDEPVHVSRFRSTRSGPTGK